MGPQPLNKSPTCGKLKIGSCFMLVIFVFFRDGHVLCAKRCPIEGAFDGLFGYLSNEPKTVVFTSTIEVMAH